MVVETEKIMKKSFPLFATCVRVPVFCGHSESVYFELKHDVPLSDLYNALSHFHGLCVVDPEQRDFWTPIEIAGRNEVFVSRLRKDPNHPRSYQMWVVSDNIRKGAALNAVQIAESYVNED